MRDYDDDMRRALRPSDTPSDHLNQKILEEIQRRNGRRKKWFGRMQAAAAAAAVFLLAGGLTAYAAWRFLSPQEVAQELGDRTLESTFEKRNEMSAEETKNCHGYEISLLGLVSGEHLRDYGCEVSEEEDLSDNTYFLIAIRREDGRDIGDEEFLASPYIRGEAPWEMNVFYMGGGAESFSKDGVRYCIIDCENLECFADRGVYLGVTDGAFVDREAFLYDEESGEIARNEGYDGVNVLFELPLDKKKADSGKAEKLLEKWRENAEADDEEEEPSNVDKQISEDWTGERVRQRAAIVKETVRTIQPNADGDYDFVWEIGDGLSGSGTISHEDETFQKAQTGELIVEYITDGEDEELIFVTYSKNADGTVTAACYREK